MWFENLRSYALPVALTALLGFGMACDTATERDEDRDIAAEPNEPIGTTGPASADQRIEEELDRMFTEDDSPDFDETDLRFDANNGIVTIDGEVETMAAKQRIEERVRTVSGVTSVINRLEVQQNEAR